MTKKEMFNSIVDKLSRIKGAIFISYKDGDVKPPDIMEIINQEIKKRENQSGKCN